MHSVTCSHRGALKFTVCTCTRRHICVILILLVYTIHLWLCTGMLCNSQNYPHTTLPLQTLAYVAIPNTVAPSTACTLRCHPMYHIHNTASSVHSSHLFCCSGESCHCLLHLPVQFVSPFEEPIQFLLHPSHRLPPTDDITDLEQEGRVRAR